MPKGDSVADHYQRVEGIVSALNASLTEAGLDPSDPDVLAGAEEFHLGGRAATDALIDSALAGCSGGHLDIGSGIGGTARHLARRTGRQVLGVDLTATFVDAASALSAQVGLSELTSFEVGDGSALRPDIGRFGSASMLHVGMNIADKNSLAVGVAEVLTEGSPFVIYDVMRTSDGDIGYPMPWASDPQNSFVETPDGYRAALEGAGFTIESITDHTELAMAAGAAAASEPPPVNLGNVMGRDFGSMIANLMPAVKAGILAPTEIIARR